MIFADGSIAEIDEADVEGAISAGAKRYTDTSVAAKTKSSSMVFPDGSIADIDESEVAGATKAGAVEKKSSGSTIPVELNAPSEKKSDGLFAAIDPSQQFGSITTPTGVNIAVDANKIPAPYNTGDYISQAQQRINQGMSLPEDIQAISMGSGKKQEAVSAYLNGDDKLGWGIDRLEYLKTNRQQLTESVNNNNLYFGTNYNPEEVLADPKKTSKYIADMQQRLVSKDPLNKYLNPNSNREIDIETLTGIISSNPKLQQEINKHLKVSEDFNLINKPVLLHDIIKSTAQKGLENNTPREELINTTAQLTDPKGYADVQSALLKINNSKLPNSNPIFAGNRDSFLENAQQIYDNADKEILNSQKGYAELHLNDIYNELANDKLAEGYVSKDPLLIAQAKVIMDNVDPDAIYRYPTILKSQMADQVARIIADKGGNLKQNEGVEIESADNHYRHFGSKQVEQIVTDLGWLNDPKKKDAANWLIDHPGEIKDASIFGGLRNAVTEPVKNLGLGILDIVGARSKVDVLVDKTKEQLFPQEFSQDELKPSLNIAGHPIYGRQTVNTIGNLAGMTAIAMATGGAATSMRLGISATEAAELSAGANIVREGQLLSKVANTSERISSYSSFAIPSIDPNLKDSYNNPNITDDGTRALYVTMGAILNGEGGRLLNLGSISKIPGLSQDFTKVAIGLSEKTMTKDAANELLNSGKDKWVNFVTKYGKPVLNGTKEDLKGAATMAYFGAVDKINRMAFGDPNAKSEDLLLDAGKSFIDGVFAMIPYGFIKGVTPTSNSNSSMKGFIETMGRFPDAVNDVFKLSKMSESDRNSKMQIVNTAVSAKNAVDATEAEMGIELQPSQRTVLIANKTVEAVLRDKASRTTDETKKNEILSQADQLRDESSKVLKNLQFTETLEPKTELFEAEQEYNKAAEEGDLAKMETAKSKMAEVETSSEGNAAPNPLADVESTTKALDKIENDNPSKINGLVKIEGFDEKELDTNDKIAKEYHEAKNLPEDIRLPEQKELVKAVEDAIGVKENISSSKIGTNEKDNNGGSEAIVNNEKNSGVQTVQGNKDSNGTGNQEVDVTGAENKTSAPIPNETVDLIKGYREKNNITEEQVSNDELLKNIAEQAQNISGGEFNKTMTPEAMYDATVKQAGKELVDAAIKVHPKETLLTKELPSPKEEDIISHTEIEFRKPEQVTELMKVEIPRGSESVNVTDIYGDKTSIMEPREAKRKLIKQHKLLELLKNCLTG